MLRSVLSSAKVDHIRKYEVLIYLVLQFDQLIQCLLRLIVKSSLYYGAISLHVAL